MATIPLHAAERATFAKVYQEYAGFLQEVARYRFNVPVDAVEDVVHEVFLSFFMARDGVRDPRAWLIGGVCNASRRYWTSESRRREEESEGARRRGGRSERWLHEISIRQVVGRLHPKCRRTLELHYWAGATARELGDTLGTTTRYAENLIHRCLRKAFRAWHHLWSDS